MRESLQELLPWWQSGQRSAVATVVETSGSAPLPPGTSMVVGPHGEAFGSVSGGCVEGAVYQLAGEVQESGRAELVRYGIADDDAIAVGLTCGGVLDVFVQEISQESFPEFGAIAESVAEGAPVAIASVIAHPDPDQVGRRLIVRPDQSRPATTTLVSDRADAAVYADSLGLLGVGRSAVLTYGPDGERLGEGMQVFCWSFAPKPRLIIFGAIDFASALARVGRLLGFRVTVCDARPVFATVARFPEADEVIVDWPHRYLAAEHEAGRLSQTTAVAVLTHDPKFDVPLLSTALRYPEIGYLGAMGSRRTHDLRTERLLEDGLTEQELARLHSPIGLDLGARTAEETALSIGAEIVAHRWGGSGQPLRTLATPMHTPTSETTSAG